MKNIKKAAIAVIGAVSLMMPFGTLAHAAEVNPIVTCGDAVDQVCNLEQPTETLNCFHDSDAKGFCDLAIDKQVSVNGGAFVEADTSADGAQAQVGDTVTWKITVTDNSSGGFEPHGILTVADVLPSGAAYDSSSATVGTYDSGTWTFDIEGNLPATLTIVSHAVSTGLFKNTATLSVLDSCSDDCVGLYSDADPSNDSNDAWFDPSAKPAVLAESTTLTNTGNGIGASLVAGGMLALTASALVAASRQKRSEV
jgi:uncharacterized repeat protein (TIGR01451 family)